jgi:predicted ATP-dependent Lon-type protease
VQSRTCMPAHSNWSATVTQDHTSSRFNCGALMRPSQVAKTGVAALIALASALLKKSVRGGLVVVGR